MQHLNVYVASTPEQIKDGLSGWSHLEEDEGMLFVLHNRMPFWMPDMLFPLDIIWLDPIFNVVAIAENVQPCPSLQECPNYLPDPDFAYVLEVNAGWAERNDIRVGQHMELW
jgi:uncharacterized protein